MELRAIVRSSEKFQMRVLRPGYFEITRDAIDLIPGECAFLYS